MSILKRIFRVRNYKNVLIDGRTKFILSSHDSEGSSIFQNIKCQLLKTFRYRGENYYLIETDVDFTGIDFGSNAKKANRFYIALRRPSSFRVEKDNDVLVYFPENFDSSEFDISSLKLINWSYIHDISY